MNKNYIGTFKCATCDTKVRVYDWLPSSGPSCSKCLKREERSLTNLQNNLQLKITALTQDLAEARSEIAALENELRLWKGK